VSAPSRSGSPRSRSASSTFALSFLGGWCEHAA
jgi:hypothetical protein